ncbi:uncharacterized protein EAE97_012018 [Botrytis byssoidea]|uniref:Uncharacterized protein n=1 Tax=Botrytis byssoidea TaxID=139641 RepID=A0A9P5HR93_9HELO|nr:uncharacterized protein EAE97_012018 [Botrytis byssoidea]KAF7917490.1 hypothetical protein EAE97_012018 [Botrytis byssoidea]
MRTLPWKKKNGSTTLTLPKKTIASVGRSAKRPRVEASLSDSDYDSDHAPKQIKAVTHSREPSTSPPPEPPTESFMEEGREHDDKYRIVEDEFLTVAKSFTVHLHTAEYKRLGKMTKTRNADAINSMSRPVVGRMPDATRRKAEEVARSKEQRSVLEKLVGKKADGLSSDSDEETLPFVGTSLYGLMTSPKKRGISLMNISSPTKTTRAAAGFRNPTKFKTSQRASSPTIKRKTQAVDLDLDLDATVSEDDDDLDAPISAPKFPFFRPINGKDAVNTKSEVKLPKISTTATPIKLQSLRTPVAVEANVYKSIKAPIADPPSHLSATQDRIARRIAQTKLRRKQEEEDKKKLDIIPTFL